MVDRQALARDVILGGEYRIGGVLGQGGFGITYEATDMRLEARRAIKEYFPEEMSRRAGATHIEAYSGIHEEQFVWGRRRFLDEARLIARFSHPNIVKVIRQFEENNTAYMVLDYVDGLTLERWTRAHGQPTPEALAALLPRLIDTLEVIHAAGVLHRDIAPDNIILKPNGEPVFVDFGSARTELGSRTRTFAVIKEGYSPPEQHTPASTLQGPWTDIYALGGTLYRMISGQVPVSGMARSVRDDLVPARVVAAGRYPEALLAGIDAALGVRIADRPQSVAQWRALILPGTAGPATATSGAVSPSPPDAGSPPSAPHMPSPLPAGARAPVAVPNAAPEPDVAPVPDAAQARPGLWGRLFGASDGVATRLASAATPDAGTPPPVPIAIDPAAAARQAAAARLAEEERVRQIQAQDAAAWAQAEADGMIAGWQGYLAAHPTGIQATAAKAAITARQADRLLRTFEADGGQVQAVALSHDGARMLTGGADEAVRLWDVADGACQRVLRAHKGRVWSVAFCPDRRTALSAGEDGRVRLWDLANGSVVRTLTGHFDPVLAVAATPDGLGALSGSNDRSVLRWDLASGTPAGAYDAHNEQVWAVAVSTDGRRALSGGLDRVLRLHDLPSLSLVGRFAAQPGGITSVAFAPDGRTAVSGHRDGAACVWDLTAPAPVTAPGAAGASKGPPAPVRILRGHTDLVRAVAYAAQGRLIVTGGGDGAVRVWRADTGALALTLAAHRDLVTGVAGDPARGLIMSAGADGAVRMWDVTDLAGG